MKKYFVLLIILSVFFTVSCKSKADEITTIEVILPLDVYMESGDFGISFDLGVTPLDVRVKNSLNSSVDSYIEDTTITYTYNPEELFENVSFLEGYEFLGLPITVYNAVLEVDIYTKDIEKLNKKVKQESEFLVFKDNILWNKYISFTLQNIYTGEIIHENFTIKDDEPRYWNKEDIIYALDNLQPVFDEAQDKLKNEYYKYNTELVDKAIGLTQNIEGTKNKASMIMSWIYKNIAPASSDEIEHIKNTSISDSLSKNMGSVDFAWNYRKGVCKTKAYLTKAMLDSVNIKNKILVGYIPGVEGHIINAVFDEKQNKWIWLDTTIGHIDTPDLYNYFETSPVFEF